MGKALAGAGAVSGGDDEAEDDDWTPSGFEFRSAMNLARQGSLKKSERQGVI